jgi:hypothetical protein
MAHPGWAAAASLVVLVGVVYLQRSGKMNAKSPENPNMAAQRSDEDNKDRVMAEAPAAEPEPVSGTTAGAAPAGATSPRTPASDPRGEAPRATVSVDGYTDSTVTLDGKSEKVGGRIGNIEGGEHAMSIEPPPVVAKDVPAKQKPGPVGGKGAAGGDSYDYRQPKADETSRTGVLLQDKGGALPGGATSTVPPKPADAKPAKAEPVDKKREKVKQEIEKPADVSKEETAGDESDDAEVQAIVDPRRGGGSGGASAPAAPPRKPAAGPAPARDNNTTRTTATPTSPAPPAEAPPQAQPVPAQVNNTQVNEKPAINAPANNQRRDAPKANKKTETKQLDTSAAKLHLQARQAAKTGNCSAALENTRKIQKIDYDYWKRNVAKDAVFSECDSKQRSMEKKKKSPPRAPEQDEMPSPAHDSPASNE